jgi:hypothetical protein
MRQYNLSQNKYSKKKPYYELKKEKKKRESQIDVPKPPEDVTHLPSDES